MIPGASAHEVYVLDKSTILADVAAPFINPFLAAMQNWQLFIGWGVGIFSLLVMGLALSWWLTRFNLLQKLLLSIKHFAPNLAQLTIAISMVSCGAFNALFGPELPLTDLFGVLAPVLRIALIVGGVLLGLGLLTRVVMIFFLSLFVFSLFKSPILAAVYLIYGAEALILFFEGSTYKFISLDIPAFGQGFFPKQTKFLFLRACFAFTLIYSAFFAKFLHVQLALDTISKYQLTRFFPFAPAFIVLGALFIESLIGFFYLIGFQVRLTALVFIGFLTLSILFFKEAVWPHYILYGSSVVVLVHGYDQYMLNKWLFGKKEPIL